MNELDLLEFHHSVRDKTIKCDVFTDNRPFNYKLKEIEINETHFDTLRFCYYYFEKRKIHAIGFKVHTATKYIFNADHLILDEEFLANRVRIMNISVVGDLFIPTELFIIRYDFEKNEYVWANANSLILLDKGDRNARCMATWNDQEIEMIVPWASLVSMDHK